MLEDGLVALLRANAGLMALIDPCIYPVLIPPKPQYPCLSYQVIWSSGSYTFEGKQHGRKRIQFDAWSNTSYSDCKAVQQALRNALDTFRGTLPNGTRILGAFRGTELDFYEDASREFRVTQEFHIHFVEA
jgi:hypothetical protein